jgi:carnitine 3-dehydrogenase
MSEFRYAQVFSDSCDRLLLTLGMDARYVAKGCSYYTVETHTRLLDEVGVGERLYTSAQVLAADKKKLHVFYCLHAAHDDSLLATMEALYLHVNRKSGRAADAGGDIAANAVAIAAAHSALPRPAAAGRHVGQRKHG